MKSHMTFLSKSGEMLASELLPASKKEKTVWFWLLVATKVIG